MLMLGGAIKGLAGLAGMHQGNKMMGNIANSMPSKSELQGAFSGTQGLIDRMTNFGQYSGQAMDLASMQGNKGVEDAMMMGMGGSQANAIRNRLKRSSLTGVYDQYNKGLGQAAGLQQGIDQTVSGQLHQNAQDARMIRQGQAGALMGLGANIMGGKKGMSQFGNILGSAGAGALKGMGGLLGLSG